MKKLLILRGPQGSGKTTTLKKLGFYNYTLSPDIIRKTLSGLYLSPNGNFEIPSHQHSSEEPWKVAFRILEERMNAGEFIAFDATLQKNQSIKTLIDFANKYKYDTRIIDFYTMNIEQTLKQNRERDTIDFVSESTIRNVFESYQPTTLAQTIYWDKDNKFLEKIHDFTQEKILDFNLYKNVVNVGDIQGCYTVLKNDSSPLKNGIHDDTAYVFMADFLDRGKENAEVLKWVVENLVGKENVFIIEGNHEKHLRLWCAGEEHVSKEFNNRTLPQLIEAGITPEEITPLLDKMQDVLTYTYNGKKVLCSHAGLPNWPDNLTLVPSIQFIHGVGNYETPVDVIFSEWSIKQQALTGQEIWQVHGHSNTKNIDIFGSERSINLEGKVEYGGHLRFAILDENGWSEKAIRNTIFKSIPEQMTDTLADNKKPYANTLPNPPWVTIDAKGESFDIPIPLDRLAEIMNHQFINVRHSETHPHIVAINFSREAIDEFRETPWHEMVIKARGLFVNTIDGTIVSRAYEKFFNINERSETKINALKDSRTFPLIAYQKENGFLATVGYDKVTQSLLITSKSTLDGPFAIIAREILEKQLGSGNIEKLTRALRDMGSSATFEINDPIRDPHMIEYNEPHAILLDIIRRSEKFEKMPFTTLQKFARILDVPVKIQFAKIPNAEAFENFINRPMNDRTWKTSTGPIEGFVFEDATGYQFKLKTEYYAFWKKMRSLKDRELTIRKSGIQQDLKRNITDPEAQEFYGFINIQRDSTLEKDIIVLRESFYQNPKQVLEGINYQEIPKVSKNLQFEKALDILLSQIETNTAKFETIQKIVFNAKENPERQELFMNHRGCEQFLDFIKENKQERNTSFSR